MKNLLNIGFVLALTIPSSFGAIAEYEGYKKQFEQASLVVNIDGGEQTYKCSVTTDDGGSVSEVFATFKQENEQVKINSMDQDPKQEFVLKSGFDGFTHVHKSDDVTIKSFLRQDKAGDLYLAVIPSIRIFQEGNRKTSYFESYTKCILKK